MIIVAFKSGITGVFKNEDDVTKAIAAETAENGWRARYMWEDAEYLEVSEVYDYVREKGRSCRALIPFKPR